MKKQEPEKKPVSPRKKPAAKKIDSEDIKKTLKREGLYYDEHPSLF